LKVVIAVMWLATLAPTARPPILLNCARHNSEPTSLNLVSRSEHQLAAEDPMGRTERRHACLPAVGNSIRLR